MFPRIIAARNIFQYTRIDLKLNKDGVPFLVYGSKNGNVAASNGIGKTNLFEIINLGLYGKTIKGVKKESIVKVGAKQGTIGIAIGDYKIIRKFPNESVEISHNGKKMSYRLMEANEFIANNIVGMNWDTWKTIIFHGQEIVSAFVQSQPKDRKALFGKLLNFEFLDRCLIRVREEKDCFIKEREKIRVDLDYHKNRISKYVTEGWTLESLTAKMKGHQAELKKIDAATYTSITNWQEQISAIDKDIQEIDDNIVTTSGEYGKLSGMANTRKERIQLLKRPNDICDACGQSITKEFKGKAISILQGSLDETNVKIDSILRHLTELKERKKDKISKKVSISNDVCKINESRAANSTRKTVLCNYILQCERNMDTLDEMEADKKLVKEIEKSLIKVETSISYYSKLDKVFGQDGARVYLLNQLIPMFEARINNYLAMLTNGEFSLKIDPAKMKFSIIKGDNEFEWESYSGGEKKLIAVAIDIALGEIMVKTYHGDFGLIFDESLAQLDRIYIEKMIGLFEYLSKGLKIFLITNDMNIPQLTQEWGKIVVEAKGDESCLSN